MAAQNGCGDSDAGMLPEAEALPHGFTTEGCLHRLPEAEALPDGFSECGIEVSGSEVADGNRNSVDVVDDSIFFSQLGLRSPSSPECMVDDLAVFGGYSSVHSNKAVEKIRRFPVPLDNTGSKDLSQACSTQMSNTLSSKVIIDDGTKARKRQNKDVKLFLDSNDKTADEKMQILHVRYLRQVSENEQLEKEVLSTRLKLMQTNMEKETVSADLSKSVLLRQKLESLCRELQRQNKILIDESKKVTAEEHQKRQELSTKFHNTVKDISCKLEQQEEESVKQAKENDLLREKLKHFAQQYEVREEHFTHQLRSKSLELQLAEVKVKQQQELFVQEEAKTRMYSEQISQLLVTEQDLRSQLALYGDKFEQFQDTLTKSNEVFASFKQEMEKMSKTIKSLEKENFSLKKKCQKSDVSIIEFFDERAALMKQLETVGNQKKKLEALCRSLQAERKQQQQQQQQHKSTEEALD